MTNIREEFEKWWGDKPKEYSLDMTQSEKLDMWVWGAYQAAHEAQQKRVDELEMLLSEQLLIIKGFTLECEDMGTTDIITALSRKDAQITTLEARCKELEDALTELSEFKFCDGNDFHLNIISHTLSKKSPTEQEVG